MNDQGLVDSDHHLVPKKKKRAACVSAPEAGYDFFCVYSRRHLRVTKQFHFPLPSIFVHADYEGGGGGGGVYDKKLRKIKILVWQLKSYA